MNLSLSIHTYIYVYIYIYISKGLRAWTMHFFDVVCIDNASYKLVQVCSLCSPQQLLIAMLWSMLWATCCSLTSSCDSAYEMLFSSAMVQERDPLGSSSKAAPPLALIGSCQLTTDGATRDSQWLWARPRACTTSGSTVMVQCCTSHSRYRATGSQWSTGPLSTKPMLCDDQRNIAHGWRQLCFFWPSSDIVWDTGDTIAYFPIRDPIQCSSVGTSTLQGRNYFC